MTHTKEPWEYVTRCPGKCCWNLKQIGAEDLNGFEMINYPELSKDDARRIVACVNACAGLTTENLENILLLGDTLLDRFNALKANV
jgi:hypothetical protein